MERLKKLMKSTASVNGSYSVGLIVLVLCLVALVNLVAGRLPEKWKNIDISDQKIYEITDVSKKILQDLDEKVTLTVYAEKSSTDERIRTFLKKYAALSDQISVEWVDPVLHPAELTEKNVSENTILVECASTGKAKAVSFDQMIVVDDYSYYMTGETTESEFDAEGQITGAVNYVTSDTQKKIYYTSGHGEAELSDSVNDLLEKNNMSTEEINLMITAEIPDDCDLLLFDGLASDITEQEKEQVLSYLSDGGKIMMLLGELNEDAPNLDAVMNEYGMQRADGYIADMERCYQGNYYYIFPEISTYDELADGMTTGMVLLVNTQGMTVADPARDTIAVEEFMTTSSDAYAVTEETQEQGQYVLGAVATETVDSDAEDASDEEETDDTEDGTAADGSGDADSEEEQTGRLTVITTSTLIDSQITDAFSTLENLTLFLNAVSANFDDVQNVAIAPKSLEITYNTMQYAGFISIAVIILLPAAVLIYGFVNWWKRRKA